MMQIGISLTIAGTITISDDAGGGGTGPTPLAVSDFKNGAYSIGATSKTLDDLWHEDASWGSWNPNAVISGAGLQQSANAGESITDGQPVTTAELFSAINSDTGFVAIIDYALSSVGDGDPLVGLYVTDLPAYSEGWNWYDNDQSQSGPVRAIADLNGAISPTEPTTIATHRAAVLFSPTELAFAVDGGAVHELTGAQANAARSALVLYPGANGNTGSAAAVVTKIAFYPPQEVASLSALSA